MNELKYFCCWSATAITFGKYPIATKRALRAILKAADYCASHPANVARRPVDGGFATRYDYALQGLSELPYDKWREYDAEDTTGSTRCVCTKSARSNRVHRRSSARELTGDSLMS